MKKRLTLFSLLPILLISCGQKEEESTISEKEPIDPIGLMSHGFESSKESRAWWDWLRFKSPLTDEIPDGIRDKELAFANSLPVNPDRSYTWENRGPWNIGGRTRAIEIDVLDENTWLAGGVTGGIWRSTNAGNSWTRVTTNEQLHSVTSIVQDSRPGEENVWYASTGEYYSIVSHSTWSTRFSGNGLLKSTDNGLTWEEIESTVSDTPETLYEAAGDFDFTWKLIVDHTDLVNDVVLAAVFNGIYRSEDGGDTWEEALGFEIGSLSAPNSDYLDLIQTEEGVFYATFSSDGPTAGVWRSEDGVDWTNIVPSTGFPGSWGRLTIAESPDPGVIWFFGDTDGAFGNGHSVLKYTYLSGDGAGTGGNWEDLSENLPDEDCVIAGSSFNRAQLSTQSSFDVHVAVHPTDPDVVYIAGTSIWRSTDGWTSTDNYSWIGGYGCDTINDFNSPEFQSSYDNHHPDQHYMMFLPSDPSKMINVNDGGVYVSQDCLADSVKWDSKNNGYLTTQFYSVALEHGPTTSEEIIGGMQDNNTYLSVDADPESDWKRISGGDGMFCAITDGGEYHLSSSQYGRLFLNKLSSTGDVLAFERIDPTGGPTSYNWANALKLDPNYPKRLYWNGRNRLWRLNDLDDIIMENDKTTKEPDHWVSITESLLGPAEGIITDIEMAKGATDVVWYGTTSAELKRLDDASSDDPVQVDLTSDLWPSSAYLSSIAVHPYDSSKIVVCFANYEVPSIWRTTDGGKSWEDISGNLEENEDGSGSGPAVIWMEYYPDGTLFAGTTTGLYTTKTPDSTNTIWEFESGIGNVVINHMDYRMYDGTFVVGTHGRGVFTTQLDAAFASHEEVEKKEENLRLYPTLATNEIFISNVDGYHSFAVFDMEGRMIHQWDKNSLESPMNIAHLRTGAYLFVGVGNDQRKAIKFVKR